MDKKIYNAIVIKKKKVSASSYFMEFDCGRSVEVKAGQFISIYCRELTLRRPFSVFSNINGNIGILFKERGKGTQYLKSLNPEDNADITGPFGNAFDIANKKSLLIGAGIGAAPISFLKTKLDEKGAENLFAAGFLNKNEIIKEVNAGRIYTDDGSFGDKGSVLDYLEVLIKDYKPEIIYACGPRIVLKKTAEAGMKYGIETQVSMENMMACSIGVCRGCVIDIKRNGNILNAAVCKDGPVFRGSKVVWQ